MKILQVLTVMWLHQKRKKKKTRWKGAKTEAGRQSRGFFKGW